MADSEQCAHGRIAMKPGFCFGRRRQYLTSLADDLEPSGLERWRQSWLVLGELRGVDCFELV
jgi:hypothetical protein